MQSKQWGAQINFQIVATTSAIGIGLEGNSNVQERIAGMWKIEGKALMSTQRVLSELTAIGASNAPWLVEKLDWFKQNLASLKVELTKLSLPVSLKRVESIEVLCSIEGDPETFARLLNARISDLRDRIEDEIETRYICAISPNSTTFLKRERSILNSQVEAAFPDAIFDLHEAADCIGFSRYTAAVFHLMRAMESAITKVGLKLNATVIGSNGKNLPWGILISNIGAKISAMEAGNEKEGWQSTHAMLYSVKEAWRNDTMHPKQTYTEEEAVEVFDAVKSFMRRLAGQVT